MRAEDKLACITKANGDVVPIRMTEITDDEGGMFQVPRDEVLLDTGDSITFWLEMTS